MVKCEACKGWIDIESDNKIAHPTDWNPFGFIHKTCLTSQSENGAFLDYVNNTFEKCHKILQQAMQEYANEDERFSNFIRTANELKRNPRLKDIKGRDIGVIFLKKHLDSIISGISIREDIQGRIVDAINYLLLIGAMIERDI